MLNLALSQVFLPKFVHSASKGYYMEGHIELIDVKRDRDELITLFYYMELKALLSKLMYENDTTGISIIE